MMSNILTPRLESSLNISEQSRAQSRSPSPFKSSVLGDRSPRVSAHSSSPFQNEMDQENQPPHTLFSSPSPRKSPKKSPAPEPFEIHEDENSFTELRHSAQREASPVAPSAAQSIEHLPNRQTFQNSEEMDLDRLQGSTDEDIFMLDGNQQGALEFDDLDTQSVVSDDTCFSNFSAVPNADMTMFAKLGNRSAKRNVDATPSHSVFQTPQTSRRGYDDTRAGSPTPSKSRYLMNDNDTTNLLLDFTGHFGKTPQKGVSPSKSTTEPNLLSFINGKRRPSPKKSDNTRGSVPSARQSIMNLLDFELPPPPTPRSIPTITIRELESLKSQYLSEISSLRATLDGKEAEVKSLKDAVADAERRCGNAQEEAREERSMREHAETEKIEWEKKGKEVEMVLQSVKAEFLASEKEQEDLAHRLEEATQAREEAEVKLAEAVSAANQTAVSSNVNIDASADVDALVQQRVAQQLDDKMENLARELHAVYKKKHETKVAKLKETYELKAERKASELQRKVDDLTKANAALQKTSDSQRRVSSTPVKSAEHDQMASELQGHKAKVAGLIEEMASMKKSHALLLTALENERIEKGELVAAVDEMLALQSEVGAPSVVEDFRRSISRSAPSAVGLTPAKSEHRISKATSSSTKGSTIKGNTSSIAKSRMMSNIERMGGAGVKKTSAKDDA